ncbi:SusC/RagA family TonB-linked outer membrane protein [Yeosuana aromativorans]|uniref:SusC/RagA family TonB-linked outer membrane protein n=1 Tax=Yeosuana aromativorans TaxID=288019 RepID=A0A8J3FIW0_9FLAO|nr:SusC/RagA family TonB-linked outer membrane protein [Yeosuana aromativorans]GGK34008.1 SusC/RagA family TonB-linked outer membrane protein [Yeosuana aromativorans]
MRRNYNFLKIILPIFFLATSFTGFGQQKTVSGTITSSVDGQPIPGATVVIKGTASGVVSNFDGNYSIDNVSETSILEFSFLGYKAQEIPVQGLTTINVVLVEDNTQLDEVVVTGFTSQSKATVTTAITKVDAESLQNTPVGGASIDALQGRVSGVTILRTTGRSGDTPVIQIRGGTTPGLSGDSPLFIVDGFVQDDLGDTDMNDIEEFTVLKDAAAAAIYGARAGNGVIIIKTKRGQKGKFSVSLKYSHEDQNVDRFKIDWLTPEEEIYFARLGFVTYENPLGAIFHERNNWWSAPQAYDSNNASLLRWADDVMANNGGVIPNGYVTTADPITGRLLAWKPSNWEARTLTPGNSDSYVININGGNDKAVYNLTGSYFDNKGIGVYNSYKRYYLKASTDINLAGNLKAGSSFRYSLTDTQTGEGNSWYERSGRLPTTARYFNDDGTFFQNDSGKRNPDFTEQYLTRGRYNTDMTFNTYLEWEIIPDLKLKPSAFFRQRTYSYLSFNKANSLDGDRRDQAGRNDNTLDTQFEAILTYNKTILEDHNFGFLAGTSFQNGYDYVVSGSAFGSPSDLIPIILSSSPNEENDVSTSYIKTAQQSWFGQITYNYKRKYLLNSTFRKDGAYQFTDKFKFGLFSGISGGWNIHAENWYAGTKLSNILSKAKLSISYGESGKNNLSILDTQGAYETTSYAGQTGIRQSTLINENLKWETTKENDYRFEFSLLKENPINLSVEYYNKKAIDKLFVEPLPNYTGFTGIRQNIGDFESKGLEVGFNATPVKTLNFKWSLQGFADFVISRKTLKLPENGNPNNRIGGTLVYNPDDPTGDPISVGGTAEGEETNDLYVYANDGVIGSWEEADAYNAMVSFDELSNQRNRRGDMKVPGNYKWKDLNGDGIINSLDRYKIGNSNWRQHYSFGNTFTYTSPIGEFSLSILLESYTGHYVYDFNNPRVYSQAQGQDRIGAAIRDSYLQPGDEVSGIAQYNWADLHVMNNFQRLDDKFTQKGDFISIRNVTLNYTLPKEWVKPIGAESIKAYVVGTNLGYLTEYKGLNPEAFGTDSLGGTPPPPETVSFGVEVKF